MYIGWHYKRSINWALRIGVCLYLLSIFILNRPVFAQEQNGITSPVAGQVVSGVVIVRGTASGGSFLRYEVAFNNGSDWIVFAEGDQPVVNDTLAIWDTTVGSTSNPVYPDGVYQLRLRVVRQDFNYSEFFVPNITIANSTTLPTATIAPTEAPAGVATSAPPVDAATPTVDGASVLPTIIPTLTPFPTPSPAATARVIEPGGSGRPDEPGAVVEENQGLLGQIQALDTGRFSRAFWQGVTIAFYLFLALGVYLVLRTLWRWVWRRIR